MKKFTTGSLMLAVLFLTVLLSIPAQAEDLFEKEVQKEAEAVKLVQDVQQGEYGIVSTTELKQWMDSGKNMAIIDAMPMESYTAKHIPGAMQFLFPIPDMKTWDAKETGGKTKEDYVKLLGPDKDKTIVVYCGFVKCTRSHNAAVWAKSLGYKTVYRYPGGIYAWQGAKFQTEAAK
jgi:thiosulfate/3-mercaptopyruvate sulfurtransferase